MKKPKINIRRATDQELYIVRGLDQLCFGADNSEANETEVRESRWWLAFHNGAPIAFAGAYIYANKACELRRTGVLPAYRGIGLQKRFIKARIEYAKSFSCERVFTYAAPWNGASLNSLISCGFRVYNPRRSDDDINYVYMGKWLK